MTVLWEQDCPSGHYEVVGTLIRCFDEQPEPPPTSGDNQLLNPEFIGVHNATVIPEWDNVGDGAGHLYVISRGSLTKNKTTTGYAVKWGPVATHGEGIPGVSGFIEQIVSSNGRLLTAKITAIHRRASLANYNVYGRIAESAWSLIWQPFTIDDIDRDWGYLEAATLLDQDYDEYKVQLEARWDADNSAGVKFGDAWFSSES